MKSKEGTRPGALKIGSLWQPFLNFSRIEASAGILLFLAACFALIWANSPWSESYRGFKEWSLGWAALGLPAEFPMEKFVNDVLMAIFFLLVGMEIKREMLSGELASFRKSALPVLGALGGMLVPAAIYAALNHGLSSSRGWGIPMATDIAFALSVLLLLGKNIPTGVKVFLVALAIIDDLGAILVIAVFYTGDLNFTAMAVAAVFVLALVGLNRMGEQRASPYLILGVGLWMALYRSGVHSTVSGVLLALCIPNRSTDSRLPLLPRLEARIHPYVAFGILPLFGLVNAGVALSGGSTHWLGQPLGLGILAGLVLGKPAGILLFSWLAVKLGIGALPSGVNWKQMTGAGILGGIGFTMSLFIAGLGFPDAHYLDGAKLSVLCASLVSGTVGFAYLRILGRLKSG